jgi:hypothetical protein
MKIKGLIWVVCLMLGSLLVRAQVENRAVNQYPDSFMFQTDSTAILDSLSTDSSRTVRWGFKRFGLLDSLSSDSSLRLLVKPYQFINTPFIVKAQLRKNLPTTKEIKVRDRQNAPWKFWVIVFIFAYIAFVRIANPNNFRVFMLSVFNLKLSDKIWEDQKSYFGFVILQLFAIYLFIAAIFINNEFEARNISFVGSYFVQFIIVFAALTGIYLVKFLMHTILGGLMKMKKLGIGFVSNTISINNFLALVIFPVIIYTVYDHNTVWSSVAVQTVVAVFFISILYRVVRITLLSNRFFSFPKIYLFIYLCALEIMPWLVIVKFLNNLQI